MFACVNSNISADTHVSAIQAKIVLIYNFTQFISWPDIKEKEHLKICVDIKADIYPQVSRLLVDKRVDNRQIEVIAIKMDDSISQCHIFYISDEIDLIQSHLKKVAKLPIVTIAQHPDFIAQGGIIRLFVKQKRLRFTINNERALAVDLSINSQLLNLSRKY